MGSAKSTRHFFKINNAEMHNPECLVALGTKCCMVVPNIFSVITAVFFYLETHTHLSANM
jgi:hypothetical protein